MKKPLFILVGGPNGAGKTSVGQRIAHSWLKVKTYLNADLIAKGLGPERGTPVEAGRQLLLSMKDLMAKKASFAVESTLSSMASRLWLERALTLGYEVWVIYVYLESHQLAQARVRQRVLRGGHHVEDDVVERRYGVGLETIRYFISKDDVNYVLINNSGKNPLTAAVKTPKLFQIGDYEIFTQIKDGSRQRAEGNQ